MWEIEKNGHMTPYVAKFYKTLEDDSVVFEDAKLNMVAEGFAHDFNVQSKLPQKVLTLPDALPTIRHSDLQCDYTLFDAASIAVASKATLPAGCVCAGIRDRDYRFRHCWARPMEKTGRSSVCDDPGCAEEIQQLCCRSSQNQCHSNDY